MTVEICSRCVLPGTFPGIGFDSDGVCNFCRQSDHIYKEKLASPGIFKNEAELLETLNRHVDPDRKYDAVVPLSGGVDSCNVLLTLVDKSKLKLLAYHNDHGYEDDTGTKNVIKICRTLNVDLVITQQEVQFMKKLWKYINEADVKGINSCYVCGNIIYINALEIADRYGAPIVINGYSKGQVSQIADKDRGRDFLQILVEIIARTGDKEFLSQFIRKYEILEKRIQYESKENLGKKIEPGKILFIPFYAFDFYKIDKEVLKEKIRKRFDWQPMKRAYPARTSNCEMIWLNTYMDLKKMGYSSYHIEYAEMVRRGEFTRQQALADLEFNPPKGLVERLAEEIGVDLTRFDKKNETEPVNVVKVEVKKELEDFEF
jgi:hypothetical protein